MRDSRVRKAIDTAIAQAKKRTQQRRAFSRDVIKLGARQTKQKLAVDMLSKAGLDFEKLATEAAEQHETFESALRKMYAGIKKKRPKRKFLPTIYTTVPPPADATPSFPLCIFPAEKCSYSSPDPTFKHSCDASKAEMGLSLLSTNVGGLLGIEATPWVPPVTGSLWYRIKPPIGGTLAVIAEVLVTGSINVAVMTSSDLLDLVPSIGADARATLVVRTYQDGGTGIQAASQVIGELHRGGGGPGHEFHAWVEDLFVQVLYAQVLPDIEVAIEVSIELEGQGRSTFGHSTINLHTLPLPLPGRPGVKVAALCLNLTPTVIL